MNVPPVLSEPKKMNFGPFVAVLSILLLLAIAIFCTYLVVKGQIDANTHAIAVSQIKGSIGTCKALITLDHAGNGIQFPAPGKAHPSELALTRLFAGIHQVVQASKCQELLTLVKTKGIDGAVKVLEATQK